MQHATRQWIVYHVHVPRQPASRLRARSNASNELLPYFAPRYMGHSTLSGGCCSEMDPSYQLRCIEVDLFLCPRLDDRNSREPRRIICTALLSDVHEVRCQSCCACGVTSLENVSSIGSVGRCSTTCALQMQMSIEKFSKFSPPEEVGRDAAYQ